MDTQLPNPSADNQETSSKCNTNSEPIVQASSQQAGNKQKVGELWASHDPRVAPWNDAFPPQPVEFTFLKASLTIQIKEGTINIGSVSVPGFGKIAETIREAARRLRDMLRGRLYS